jgi:hypothetical protein
MNGQGKAIPCHGLRNQSVSAISDRERTGDRPSPPALVRHLWAMDWLAARYSRGRLRTIGQQ